MASDTCAGDYKTRGVVDISTEHCREWRKWCRTLAVGDREWCILDGDISLRVANWQYKVNDSLVLIMRWKRGKPYLSWKSIDAIMLTSMVGCSLLVSASLITGICPLGCIFRTANRDKPVGSSSCKIILTIISPIYIASHFKTVKLNIMHNTFIY